MRLKSSVLLILLSLTIVPNPSLAQMKMEHGSKSEMSMELGTANENFDLRFIDAMTLHHQGAILMAKEALQKSKRTELKKLAEAIIKAQNPEIAQMDQWRKSWYPKAGNVPMAWSTAMGHMMPMSKEQMQGMEMRSDLGAADRDFDLRFINAMIPHHEGALVMAKETLAKTKRGEVKNLAQNILSSQRAEIDQMKQWRKAWYSK
jgi:uncharacterized protein (DUF305 family)